jgi:hypothetical protein
VGRGMATETTMLAVGPIHLDNTYRPSTSNSDRIAFTQSKLLRKTQTSTQHYTSGQVPPKCLRRAQDTILEEAPDLAARAG